MGWLFQSYPVADPVAYLTQEYNKPPRHEVLDGSRVGNTVYLAIRCQDAKADKPFVIAGVFLISNTKKDGFGYKEQTECMGPNQCDCPKRIMRLLSPINAIPDPSYAAEWRANVARRHEQQRSVRAKRKSIRKSLTLGAVITLAEPVRFRGGFSATRFRIAYFSCKRPVFQALEGAGFYCRLTLLSLAGATIEPADAAAGREGE
jgi:hypothetical protein